MVMIVVECVQCIGPCFIRGEFVLLSRFLSLLLLLFVMESSLVVSDLRSVAQRRQRNRKRRENKKAKLAVAKMMVRKQALQQLPMLKKLPVARKRATRLNRFVKEERNYILEIAKQITNPVSIQGGQPHLTPAPMPTRAQATHKKAVHEFLDIPDQFTICVSPTEFPISVTQQTSGNLTNECWLTGAVENDGFFHGEAAFSSQDDSGNWEPATLIRSSFVTDSTNVSKFCIQVSAQAADIFDVYNTFWGGEFVVWMLVSNVWTNMGTFIGGTSGAGNNVTSFTVPGGGMTAFAIEGDGLAWAPQIIDNAPLLDESHAFSTPGGISPVHLPVSIQLPPDAEMFRITALSLLLSFEGSDQLNQGAITVCRAPPHWNPYEQSGLSPFDAISSLALYSYNGPLKSGAYSFYLPTHLTEFDMRQRDGIDSGRNYTKLWACIKGADVTAVVRAQVDLIVEFYSQSDYYSREACPYFDDAAGRLYYRLGINNPSTANGLHIGKMLSQATQAALSGVKSVADTVSSVAQASAPVLALTSML